MVTHRSLPSADSGQSHKMPFPVEGRKGGCWTAEGAALAKALRQLPPNCEPHGGGSEAEGKAL